MSEDTAQHEQTDDQAPVAGGRDSDRDGRDEGREESGGSAPALVVTLRAGRN